MFTLPYFSESGFEIFYGTEDSAGLDLPLWDARLTSRYKQAEADGMSEEDLKKLEAEITLNKEEMMEASITLGNMEGFTIKTGIYMTIPKGCYGDIDTRSSTSKIKLDLLCHTIDRDYTKGNIRLAIINLNKKPVTIRNGQSIAQIIIKRYEKVNPNKIETFEDYLAIADETDRGDKGFGSTGRNV